MADAKMRGSDIVTEKTCIISVAGRLCGLQATCRFLLRHRSQSALRRGPWDDQLRGGKSMRTTCFRSARTCGKHPRRISYVSIPYLFSLSLLANASHTLLKVRSRCSYEALSVDMLTKLTNPQEKPRSSMTRQRNFSGRR